MNDEICSICLEHDQKNYTIVQYSCSHWNCLQCYQNLIPNVCPMCRSDIKDVEYKGCDQIYVKSMNNNSAIVNINLKTTYHDDIRFIMIDKWKLNYNVRLYSQGRYLNSDKVLSEHGIKRYDTLYIFSTCYGKIPIKLQNHCAGPI